MAIGRISGSVLKSNLTRNGVDLAFETNLLYLDVTNSRIGIGTSEPTTTLDVAGTVKATAFTGDGSGLTGINVNTNIQIVGDDSTGAILGTGETFKIAGGNNITTAVSGDTLTVTGSKDINVNSITSDDSTAIQINDNINIAGNIVPTTTLTYSLGSPTKKFQDAYFGAGTVYIGDESITSTASGLVFSSVTTDNTTDDDTAIVFSKSGIRSTAKTIESFDSSSADSALYFTVYRDESNDQNQVQKISLVHDTASASHSTSGIVVSGSANSPTFTSDLNGGSVQLKATGTTEANSIKGYKISLGDNSTSGTSGHTAVITPGSVAESFVSVIDSWSNSSYRAAKYFISAKNTANSVTNNMEAVVLHDGSNAYLNVYNVVKTNPDASDLISLSAAYNGSNIELSAQSNGNSIRVIMHRILLSSDETAAEYTNVKIVDEQTISSASTIIDTFNTTKLSGALYFVTASNDTSGYYAAGEAYVVTDGTDAYVAIGPNLSSNDAFSVEYSATLSGNIVNFKASASIDSATKITAYRIGLLEAQATGDFSSTVTLDTAQTITGNKTFNGTLTANDLTVDTNTLYVNATNDRVGIGTSTPSVELDVVGDGAFSGSVITGAIELAVTSDPSIVTDKAHVYAKDADADAVTNLITHSEQFDNSAWVDATLSALSTVTANDGTDPLGGSTADRISGGTGGSMRAQQTGVSYASGTTYTFSVYVKGISGQTVGVGRFNPTQDGDVTVTTHTLNGTWQRLSHTFTATATNSGGRVVVTGNGDKSQTATDFLVWGAQLEAGTSSPGVYVQTTTTSATGYEQRAEVYVKDESGNVTKISPHNEAGEWEYYSRNTKTGKVVRVNMEEMIRDLEKLTGKTYIKNQ